VTTLVVISILSASACGIEAPTSPTPAEPTGPVAIPIVALAALTFDPETVTGGMSTQGTATLSAAAPAGGTVVSLSSDAAVLPASLMVPSGATHASFTVTTQAVSEATQVVITGSAGGQTRTACCISPSR
jgi:hypothetical protein